jgi:hypothetical protein
MTKVSKGRGAKQPSPLRAAPRKDPSQTRVTTPVAPPTPAMARKAAKALATGKAPAKDIRALAARTLAEREQVIQDKPKPTRPKPRTR